MRTRKVAVLLVLMIFILSITTTVFADTVIPINSNDEPDIVEAIKAASIANGGNESDTKIEVRSKDKSAKDAKLTIMSYASGKLTFYEKAFNQSNIRDSRKALKVFVDTIKYSGIPLDTQQDIMQQIQESDTSVASMMIPMVFDNTKADMYTAYRFLAPFIPIVNFILGIAAYFIIFMLLFTTVIDLVYIGLPMWRESMEDKAKGKKPFGVSQEALSVVAEVEKNFTVYQNGYIKYLKRRSLVYVVLSICILYLVGGGLSGLIAFVLSLGSGLM